VLFHIDLKLFNLHLLHWLHVFQVHSQPLLQIHSSEVVTSQYVSEMQETCYVDPWGAVWTDHNVLQNYAALPTQGAHSNCTSLLDNPNPRTPRAPYLSAGASLCLSHPVFPLDFFAYGHLCQTREPFTFSQQNCDLGLCLRM